METPTTSPLQPETAPTEATQEGAPPPEGAAPLAAPSPLDPGDPFEIPLAGSPEPLKVAGANRVMEPLLRSYVRRGAAVAVEAGEAARKRQDAILEQLGAPRGPDAPSRAININLNRIDTPEQVHQLIDVVATELEPVMQKARRGTRSFEQIAADAMELGFTEQDVLRWRPGDGWTPEKVTAARFVMADTASQLDTLMAGVREGRAGDVEKAEAMALMSKYAGLQAAVHGAAAEAGRTLAAMKIHAQPGKLQLQQARDMLKQDGGKIEEIAEMWAHLYTPAQKAAFARSVNRPGAWAMLKELYMNSLLSGLTTQTVNAMSNALIAAYMPMERAIAGSAGWVRSRIPGQAKGVLPGEAAYEMLGYVSSLKDAFKLMAYTLRTEDVAGEALRYDASSLSGMDILRGRRIQGAGEDTAGKMDQSAHRAITGENVLKGSADVVNAVARRQLVNPDALNTAGAAGKFFDVLGQFVRLPGRGMGAADQVFKTLAYRGEMTALAYRDAISNGLTDRRDIAQHVQQFLSQPPEEAVLKGMSTAGYRTFTDPLTSQAGKGAQDLAAGGGWFIMPFVRTPLNILSFSAERMGLRPMKIMSELASPDPAVKDTAIAKLATGAAFWTTAMALAAENFDCADDAPLCFTGAAPADRDLASTWRLNHQEYSVRVNGTWYSYSRMDPWGQMMGIAVDALQVMQQADEAASGELATAMVFALGNNVINKTYMSGAAEFFSVFTSYDPEEWQRYMVRQTANPLTPTFLANIERTKDPESRLIDHNAAFLEQVMQQMKSRSPWHSSELAQRRNVWGEKVLMTTALHANWISPIWTHKAQRDELNDELFRLGVPVSYPSKQLNGVPLTPHEWSRYVELVGNGYKMGKIHNFHTGKITGLGGDLIKLEGLGFRDAMRKLIKTKSYQAASDSIDPPGGKVLLIRALHGEYKAAAGHALMAEFERLLPAAEDAYRQAQSVRGAGGAVTDAKVMGYRTSLHQNIRFSLTHGTPGYVKESTE